MASGSTGRWPPPTIIWLTPTSTRRTSTAPYNNLRHILLESFVELSKWGVAVNLVAAGALIFFFFAAVAGYALHGWKRDTTNQFADPVPGTHAFMTALLVAEIGGFAVLLAGFVAGPDSAAAGVELDSPQGVVKARSPRATLARMNAARRTTVMILAALVALAAALVGVAQSANPKPKTIRVSVKSNGKEANSAESEYPSLSANGRFVSFESGAKLTPGDSGADFDIFVHDRKTGKTTRVSVASGAGRGKHYPHQEPAISADGAWAGFASMGAFTGGDAGTEFDTFERGPLH